MRFGFDGNVVVLDDETKEKITAARERLFGRLGGRIDEFDVRVDHIAQSGSALCQTAVRTANRVQALSRRRDRDALGAALTALKPARNQITRAFNPLRQRRPGGLSAVTP